MKQIKKRFLAKHSKSSALVFSLIVHSAILIAGLTWVVAENFIKPDPGFIAKPTVDRPSMPLKSIQVPVNVRKRKPARPTFKPVQVNQKVVQELPEFQLPDFGTLKGSFGGTSGGRIATGTSLGFMMPEIGILGTKAKGEKFFLILDAGNHMLEDRMGGIPAYTIIKQELIRVVEELPPTALFNICVFGNEGTMTLFPQLVSANELNAAKMEAWLRPLNGAEQSVQSGAYGMHTLGEGGIWQKKDLRTGRFLESLNETDTYRQDRWFLPAMVAMKQQADTVFLLTNTWGNQRVVSSRRKVSREEWYNTSDGKRWLSGVAKAKERLAEENRRRKEAGQPPRVIAHGNGGLMSAYFPDAVRPPSPEFYHFTPRDFTASFDVVREEHKPEGLPERSGVNKRRKNKFTFNVVQFVPADSTTGSSYEKFRKLVGLCRGEYQTIAGLDAIQSYLNEQE
jgi:hypothetical protein